MKRHATDCEKIFANFVYRGIVSRILNFESSKNIVWKWTKDERHFTYNDTQAVNNHTRKWSTLLASRQTQMKNIIGYHYTPIRIV